MCAGKLSDEAAAEMVQNMHLAAPEVDSILVQLLSRWAQRGRGGSPGSQVRDIAYRTHSEHGRSNQ